MLTTYIAFILCPIGFVLFLSACMEMRRRDQHRDDPKSDPLLWLVLSIMAMMLGGYMLFI